MKLFISADIEGIAGILYKEDIIPGGRYFEANCIEMSKEVAAVCRAAAECGYDEIVIKDAHGDANNLRFAYLPAGVTLIRGWENSPYQMVEGLDESFDAIAFVGYHCEAGNPDNPRSHTMCSHSTHRITLNGIPLSEYYINCLLAATFGVPPIFLSGDRAICESSEKLTPGLTTAAVKDGRGGSVICCGQEEAEEILYQRALLAFGQDPKTLKPAELPEKYHCEVCFKEHPFAAKASYYPGCRRVDAYTVAFDAQSPYELAQTLLYTQMQ